MLYDLAKAAWARHQAAAEIHDLPAVAKICDEYEALLNSAPEEFLLLNMLGTAKLQLGCNGSAITYFKACLAQKPEIGGIWGNLGCAYRAEMMLDKAWECFQKELELDPPTANSLGNLASFFINQGNPQGGIEYVEKALALDPELGKNHWNYGLLLLELQQWRKGFEQYEYGLMSFDRPMRHYHPDGTTRWSGEPGRVVVYGEQGMGDEIMWGMCLPKLMEETQGNVIFDCHPRLQSMWERSFGIKCHGTRKDVKFDWPKETEVDYAIAMGSLFLRYFPDGGFPREPYIKPDLERVSFYRDKLKSLGPGPYVGMGWKAGHKSTSGEERSFKLSDFKDLVSSGGTWISLQYRFEEGKCSRFKEQTGLTIHHWPDVVEAGEDKDHRTIGYNYDETIALVAALDFCIVPNTTIVHLCGAMGKECWTLTPDKCAWRYVPNGGDHMPMYGPWVRQFRENGDWDACFKRVLAEFRGRL